MPTTDLSEPAARPRRVDFAHLAVAFTALIVAALAVWIVGDVLWRGLAQIDVQLLTSAPTDAGRTGGIAPILVSTFLILLVSLACAGPLGLATAIALTEIAGPQRRQFAIQLCLDILAGVPSVVFGLFGNALFCVALGLGHSILAGGLTLACMILPLLTRTTVQALQDVPADYRLAAASLGMSRTAALLRVLLPTALPAIAAGLLLSVGRALAETAALLFTSGYVTRMPHSVLDSGRALSIHIYDLAMNVAGGNPRAYAAAAVLVLLLASVNSLALLLVHAPRDHFRLRTGDLE